MAVFGGLLLIIVIIIYLFIIGLITTFIIVSIVAFIRGKKRKGLFFLGIALLLSLLAGYRFFLLTNSKPEYTNVYWTPKNKDLEGTYFLDREYHEKDKLPHDSTVLILNKNGTFKAKNFLALRIDDYSNNFKLIPYSEGKWSLEKSPIANIKNDYFTSIVLEYSSKYGEYNKDNKFLKTEQMQMKVDDSIFTICFFTGDPDHNKYRYYFHQIKK